MRIQHLLTIFTYCLSGMCSNISSLINNRSHVFSFVMAEMRFKKLITTVLCVLSFSCVMYGEDNTTYSFLDIPSSAQAMALGGTNVSVISSDVSLVGQNPALLGPEIEAAVGLHYMHYMGSGNFAGVRYAMAAGERGAWSAGIRYLNYGEITRTEADGSVNGTFSPQDLAVDAVYSHDFTDRLRGGITLKLLYSHYEIYEAFAMGADVGLNYYDDEKDLSLSLVLRNMGGQIKRFHDNYDRLPFDIQLGYTQGIGGGPFSISVTAWHLNKWKLPYYEHKDDDNESDSELKSGFVSNLFRHLVFGLKYSPSDNFYIAAGYNYKTRTDMSTYKRNFLSGFSLGLGLDVKSFSFSAAYSMPHKSASQLMLNVAMNISELLPQ